MLATSVSALKLVATLARRQIIQLPQVIYLDSGHHEGEASAWVFFHMPAQ